MTADRERHDKRSGEPRASFAEPFRFDARRAEDMSFTRPTRLACLGEELSGFRGWTDVYRNLARILVVSGRLTVGRGVRYAADGDEPFDIAPGVGATRAAEKGGLERRDFGAPGYYLALRRNPTWILTKIRALVAYVGLEPREYEIEYERTPACPCHTNANANLATAASTMSKPRLSQTAFEKEFLEFENARGKGLFAQGHLNSFREAAKLAREWGGNLYANLTSTRPETALQALDELTRCDKYNALEEATRARLYSAVCELREFWSEKANARASMREPESEILEWDAIGKLELEETKPTRLVLCGEEIVGFQDWTSLYARCVQEFIARKLLRETVVRSKKSRAILLGGARDRDEMTKPVRLGETKFYLATFDSVKDTVRMLRGFRKFAGLRKDELEIEFRRGVEKKVEVATTAVNVDAGESKDSTFAVDLNNIPDLTDASPVRLTLFGHDIVGWSSWRALHLRIAERLVEMGKFKPYAGLQLRTSGSVDFGEKNDFDRMTNPCSLPGTELYMSTKRDGKRTLRYVKYLLDYCGVLYESVRIEYAYGVEKKKDAERNVATLPLIDAGSNVVIQSSGDRPVASRASGLSQDERELWILTLQFCFPDGLDYASELDYEEFCDKYEEETGARPSVQSFKAFQREIKRICVVVEERAYLPELMVPEELAGKIVAFIEHAFENGATAVYYEALYEQFRSELRRAKTNSPEALRQWLAFQCDPRWGWKNKKYVAATPEGKADPTAEIVDAINENPPMSAEDLAKKLPHITKGSIAYLLSLSPECINNGSAGNSEYFTVESVYMTPSQKDALRIALEKALEKTDVIDNESLMPIIEEKVEELVVNNEWVQVNGWKNFIKSVFSELFDVTSNGITRKNEGQRNNDIIKNFCIERERFTFDEFEKLAASLGTKGAAVLENVPHDYARVDSELFVKRSSIAFPTEEIDQALDFFCSGDYMPISEIVESELWGNFPGVGFPWNEFLLESFLDGESETFILLSAGKRKSGTSGALVRKEANIQSFDELLAKVLAFSDVELTQDDALNYLVEKKFLMKRKYSQINSLIVQARELRNRIK